MVIYVNTINKFLIKLTKQKKIAFMDPIQVTFLLKKQTKTKTGIEDIY